MVIPSSIGEGHIVLAPWFDHDLTIRLPQFTGLIFDWRGQSRLIALRMRSHLRG